MKGEQKQEVKKVNAGGVEVTGLETPKCIGEVVLLKGEETKYNFCQEPEGEHCKHRTQTYIPFSGTRTVCAFRKNLQSATSKEQ